LTATSNDIGQIILSTGGQTNVDMMTSANPLNIFLVGVQTPSNPGGGGTNFTWDSTTDANQPAGSGLYYIKFEEQDIYGHTNVVIRTITMMTVNQYVEVVIYNSAGEKVRTIRDYKDISNTSISLKVGTNNSGMVVLEKGSNAINITYGTNPATDYITWDGLNDQGLAVSGGNYEVQVNMVTSQVRSTVATKSIVVLTEKAPYMGGVSILPNPYVNSESASKQIKFAWAPGTDTGWMNVTVYTIIGEKVTGFDAPLQAGYVVWDLKTQDSSRAANGYYVVVFESRNINGRMERKIAKLVMLGTK
jgi:flagellar hook assembly protein FlgD